MEYVKIQQQDNRIEAEFSGCTGYGATTSEALKMIAGEIESSELDYDDTVITYAILRPDDSVYACFSDYDNAKETLLSANDAYKCRIVGLPVFGEIEHDVLCLVVNSDEHPLRCFGTKKQANEWLYSLDDSDEYSTLLRGYNREPHERSWIG